MKEIPILMNTEMVRAVLDSRKNQTRRIVNPIIRKGVIPQYHPDGYYLLQSYETGFFDKYKPKCPYGKVGDLFYVRETWALWLNDKGLDGFQRCTNFKADNSTIIVPEEHFGWWDKKELRGYLNRPSIHMPKWAARIWLKITDIRVERVQDISEEDAKVEGVCMVDKQGTPYLKYRSSFMALWDSINFKRGFGWGLNPYVWVVEFERIEK